MYIHADVCIYVYTHTYIYIYIYKFFLSHIHTSADRPTAVDYIYGYYGNGKIVQSGRRATAARVDAADRAYAGT
jgi:hypothetical protein